jgi:mono/diheme cytochrome c family protein
MTGIAWAAMATFAARIHRLQDRRLRLTIAVSVCVIGLGVCACLVLATIGAIRANNRSAPIPEVAVMPTTETVLRGKSIADDFCGVCHSMVGPMAGGRDIGKELSVSLGSFVPPNLTPGGPLRTWTDAQIFRAVRNNIGADGEWLMMMSYTNAGRLSDEDILAVITYLRSVEPIAPVIPGPADKRNLLCDALLGASLLPSGAPINFAVITAPAKAATAEYGEYILSYQDCRSCHGAHLEGGNAGQMAPIGPSLQRVRGWSLEQFIVTLRTGVDPSGHRLDPRRMPWEFVGRMDDEELGALYASISQRPARPVRSWGAITQRRGGSVRSEIQPSF